MIAYRECTPSTPPNANHTSSSTYGQLPSCSPPVPSSPYLVVGTPDNNGSPAAFQGSVRFDVCPAGSCPAADVIVTTKIDGVHCSAALRSANTAICPGPTGAFHPYTGNLRVDVNTQITDHCNKTSSSTPPCPAQPGLAATMWSFSIPVIVPCANVGGAGRCNSVTSLNAVSPGFISGGYRMNVASTVRVQDGGTDGDGMTPGNGIFATEGFFVP